MDIVSYAKSFDRSGFSCGRSTLDEWLQTQATQQERANNTRTFLAIENDAIVGYYATTTYRLELDEVATMYGAGKRKYPIPAVLLARLAVGWFGPGSWRGCAAADPCADRDRQSLGQRWFRSGGRPCD